MMIQMCLAACRSMAHSISQHPNRFMFQCQQLPLLMVAQALPEVPKFTSVCGYEIEGCDFTAGNVSEECKVPVLADVGPYYDIEDVSATTPADRLGRFLIENYMPHGYAVAQVSVFGTGNSNKLHGLNGTDEQRGIDAAVSFLGEASWSNGKVGLIEGKSYDGSTPWQAATFGNPYLATIVPMSGLIGVHELMWRNGSMEARGPIMHNGVYGSFERDGDGGDAENLCEGYIEEPSAVLLLTKLAAWLLGNQGNTY